MSFTSKKRRGKQEREIEKVECCVHFQRSEIHKGVETEREYDSLNLPASVGNYSEEFVSTCKLDCCV